MGIKLLNIIAWVMGVFFILCSLVPFSEGWIIPGILMLLGAAFILPPVKSFMLKKNAIFTKGNLTIIGSILIIISFVIFSLDGDSSPVSDETPLEIKGTSGKEDENNTAATDVSNSVEEDSVEEDLVEEDLVAEGSESNNEVDEIVIVEEDLVTEDSGYDDDAYNNRSKRSKLPNPLIDFSISLSEIDNTPVLSFVSKNKQPLEIYDVVINDGITCSTHGATSGVINYAETFDIYIVNCNPQQVVEVKIITEKGYNIFSF